MTTAGRKYEVVMSALVGAFVLALFGKLTTDYSTVATVVVASFSAANAYITGKTASAPPADPGSPPQEQ